jgi:hypothetical protein
MPYTSHTGISQEGHFISSFTLIKRKLITVNTKSGVEDKPVECCMSYNVTTNSTVAIFMANICGDQEALIFSPHSTF